MLSGISPLHIRRSVQADWEKTKMEMDTRHVMNRLQIPKRRLKSRNGFLKGNTKLNITQSKSRLEKWEAETNRDSQWLQSSETTTPGHENQWLI